MWNIVMWHYALAIYLHCCKGRILNFLLVSSYTRFREDLQVRTLTAWGLPRVRIRIMKEYTHIKLELKKMFIECYFSCSILWVP